MAFLVQHFTKPPYICPPTMALLTYKYTTQSIYVYNNFIVLLSTTKCTVFKDKILTCVHRDGGGGETRASCMLAKGTTIEL